MARRAGPVLAPLLLALLAAAAAAATAPPCAGPCVAHNATWLAEVAGAPRGVCTAHAGGDPVAVAGALLRAPADFASGARDACLRFAYAGEVLNVERSTRAYAFCDPADAARPAAMRFARPCATVDQLRRDAAACFDANPERVRVEWGTLQAAWDWTFDNIARNYVVETEDCVAFPVRSLLSPPPSAVDAAAVAAGAAIGGAALIAAGAYAWWRCTRARYARL